jgi:hypothetical protein
MNPIDRRRILLAGTAIAATTLGAGVGTAAAQAQTPSAQQPNILFMLVDNLGYGELGVYGGGATRGRRPGRL